MTLILLIALLLLTRLWPYLQSAIPLGYDPGLYLFMFRQYAQVGWEQFAALPAWIAGNEPGMFIFQRLVTFGNPAWAEASLIPLIVLASLLCFGGMYLVAKKLWGQGAAFWTIFLFTISALQYRVYWYYYLKNIAALSLLSLAVYALLSLSYWAVPLVALTFYIHQPTAAFLLAILLVGWWSQRSARSYYTRVLLLSLLLVAPYYAVRSQAVLLPLLTALGKGFNHPGAGTFYDPLPALGLSLIYLPFGIWGFLKQRREKKTLLLVAPLALALLAVLFKVFFWRRLIIFADFFLLFFAGWAADQFFRTQTRLHRVARVAYIIIGIIFIAVFIRKTAQPLVYPDELTEIRLLQETEPDAFVLVPAQEYMPFVYGWSGRKVIAPGFGEHDVYWTVPEWHQFWESNDRQLEKALLLRLPQPLYIFKGERTAPIATDLSGACFERINWRTYKFICHD